jgi:Glu-tRNA(Gln) amidotransferase subunit E-like FAD-binding protein
MKTIAQLRKEIAIQKKRITKLKKKDKRKKFKLQRITPEEIKEILGRVSKENLKKIKERDEKISKEKLFFK